MSLHQRFRNAAFVRYKSKYRKRSSLKLAHVAYCILAGVPHVTAHAGARVSECVFI